MRLKLHPWAAIQIAKAATRISKFLRLGAGTTWPGEIALFLNPNITQYLPLADKKIVMITGTNGKTTTTKLIETILLSSNKKAHHNASGSNLFNGIVTSLISNFSFRHGFSADYFILEVDEAALPTVMQNIKPQIIVLLDLFRDQLDRYGEVDAIAEHWQHALQHLTHKTTVIINADDPQLAFIGAHLKTHTLYFGLNDSHLFLPHLQHATDSLYCPQCGERLTFTGTYFSHLGKWTCHKCGFSHPPLAITAKNFVSPIEGIYNEYNVLAAAAVVRTLGLSDEKIKTGLKQFTPAFGRMEIIKHGRKHLEIALSKNPTGFNESLRNMLASKHKGSLLLALDDRIPDGTDISWIWDVDFEILKNYHMPIIITGDRCLDLGLRLKYAELQHHDLTIEPDLKQAITLALKKTHVNQKLWVLPTYSAMLDIRKILVGRKIL
jgi:UDP-N-acetylmuramyl tripeptide synthase